MAQEYEKLVQKATRYAICVALFLLSIKITAWWLTHSVSLLAAIVDSFIDVLASFTNLLVLKFAFKPADESHSFGHGKAESLAALAQSMFICGSAVFLLLTGFQSLFLPRQINYMQIGVVVIVIAIITTAFLVTFQYDVVKKTGSQAIKADMLHYQSDLLMNLSVLLAFFLSWVGFYLADALIALSIGIYILYNAGQISWNAIQSLLDRSLPEEDLAKIASIVKYWPGASGAHDIRTRQSGAVRFIQFHLELDDNLPLIQAHEITDRLENALAAQFPQAEITIHQEPSSSVTKDKRGQWII